MPIHSWYEDWTNPAAGFENVDAERLPDVVATIGKVAYAAGPEAIGGGEGMTYAWRVQAIGSQLVISRLSDDKTEWIDEQSPYPADVSSFATVSLGFTTAGHPVVAGQKPSGVAGAPEVWIAFLNSLTQEYEITNFGPGRSPICFLDTPLQPSTSDVTVMYINADNTAVNYRLQRDRYADEYEAITAVDLGLSLENAYLILGGGSLTRSRVLGVIHDPVTGTYPTQFNFFSSLQPISVSGDESRANVSLETAVLVQEIIDTAGLDESRANVELIALLTALSLIDTAGLDESRAAVELMALSTGVNFWEAYGTAEALAAVSLENVDTLQIVIIVPGPEYGRPNEEVRNSVVLQTLETAVP